jgi:precorrin-2 dehydrogenase/sirohydrochlorin ferrochelatase
MPHSSYPVALDLYGRHCLVVGGGSLAREKVEGLLRADAQVTVVDPDPHTALRAQGEAGEIELHVRPYGSTDLEGIWLAYGASDDRALNARVAADARIADVLVNAVDDIPNCDFFAMSLVRRGDLQIAASTNGRSPALARWVREYLDAWLPRELGGLLDVMADVRTEVRAGGSAPPYERWNAAIDDEVLLRLRQGDGDGARARFHQTLTDSEATAGSFSAPFAPPGVGR